MTNGPKFPIRDKRQTTGEARSAAPSEEEGERDRPMPEVPTGPSVDEIQALADDRLDQLMRLKADFENFRKRELREKTDLIDRASLRIVEQLLPVLDDLERSLESATKHQADEAIIKGVDLVRRKLHDVLVSEGLERVEAEGAFDPAHHEAVATTPGEVGEPTVLEVVRAGYRMKGKTIRPALVHVSVPKEQG